MERTRNVAEFTKKNNSNDEFIKTSNLIVSWEHLDLFHEFGEKKKRTGGCIFAALIF